MNLNIGEGDKRVLKSFITKYKSVIDAGDFDTVIRNHYIEYGCLEPFTLLLNNIAPNYTETLSNSLKLLMHLYTHKNLSSWYLKIDGNTIKHKIEPIFEVYISDSGICTFKGITKSSGPIEFECTIDEFDAQFDNYIKG